jgi:adsorption protein B
MDDLGFESEALMEGFDTMLSACAVLLRETALFAAFGFLLLGVSDLLVDLIWLGLRLFRRRPAQALPAAAYPGRLAILVPAWDEAAVIGRMLTHAQAAFGEAHYRLYVGCYPNDPATIAAVRAAAGPRVRLVIGPTPGPTSKADCLNRIWERMQADEAADGAPFKAVILHDAEDVVHSAELPLFDALIEEYDLVQLPVLPLVDPHSRFVSGMARSWSSARRLARACPRPASAAPSRVARLPCSPRSKASPSTRTA